MASLDDKAKEWFAAAREDTEIVPITNTATTEPAAAAAAAADTNMTASTAHEETTTAATNTATTNGTTNAVNATDNSTTSRTASSENNNAAVHRTIKTIRKVAKRTPFPVAAAPATVAVENEEEERTTTTTATAAPLQVVNDTDNLTQEQETSSAIKVTQEEGEESGSDDSERRDATLTGSPVAAATDVTPLATTHVPTTANKITTTITQTDTARILKRAVEPHLNDVLFVDDNCYEDSKINKKWPGNRQYRAWIQARVFDFQNAASRSEQTKLARQVSSLVRRQTPAGRFLERLSYPADDLESGIDNNNATTTTQDSEEKSKSVWVELDDTAVLMELSKSLWETPLENSKLSDKQQQLLLTKMTTKQEASGEADSDSPMKNGNGSKRKKSNENGPDHNENGARTSQHEQQLLLQHAKAASQYGDYFHTLYITPVYSDSQSPSSNTAASMMRQKQQIRNQQQEKKLQQQRKPALNKSASGATKRRPSLDTSQDISPNGDNDVEMDNYIMNNEDDSKSEQKSGKSVDESKVEKKNVKAKRKSTGGIDKKPTKQPKRSNSNSFDKPKAPRRSTKKVVDRSSKGTIVVSPLPSEPARRKAWTSDMGFTTSDGGTVDLKTKPATSPKMKGGEKKSRKQTTTDELGLPRGVTMRPSGKWQAQFYFAGQSRYIGVFQSAYDAAAAYEIVRELLEQARKRDTRGTSTLTKEDRSQLFDDARRAAHEGVFENKEDNELSSSLNYANNIRPTEEENGEHAAKVQAILSRSIKPEDPVREL